MASGQARTPSAAEPSATAAAAAAFGALVEVDVLEVLAIVDNETDSISTPCWCCDPSNPAAPAPYTSEFTYLTQAVLDGRQDELDIRRMVHAGHGLSLLLTAQVGEQQYRLLVDGGPSQGLWADNAAKLGVDVCSIQAAVLTHWHADHSVGLQAVADLYGSSRAAATVPAEGMLVFDVHPKRPYRRGFKLSTGESVVFNADVELAALQQAGTQVQHHDAPHTLLGNTFFVSGPIPRVTPYEVGMPPHHSQWEKGGPFEPDPLIMDERCVAVKVKGLGPVVVTGCSHAGVVNVVHHINSLAAVTSSQPCMGLIGGLHLAGKGMEARIPPTLADLQATLPPDAVVLAGHCTGWRAKAALAQAFPKGFQPCVVGGRYKFQCPPPPPAEVL